MREVKLKTAKDEVRELLQNLPDDASLEDIQYHLYVRQKIQRVVTLRFASSSCDPTASFTT